MVRHFRISARHREIDRGYSLQVPNVSGPLVSVSTRTRRVVKYAVILSQGASCWGDVQSSVYPVPGTHILTAVICIEGFTVTSGPFLLLGCNFKVPAMPSRECFSR
jgi:hypothetical protein